MWEHHGRYTVTEAKFSASIGTAYGTGKAKVKRGKLPAPKGLNPSLELLYYLLSDYTDKRGVETTGQSALVVQMSVEWVKDRATREGLDKSSLLAIRRETNDRRAIFVSFEADGALGHGQALAGIHMGKPEADIHPHTTHGIMKDWAAADIDVVVDARVAGHKARLAAATASKDDGAEAKTSKPVKPNKTK